MSELNPDPKPGADARGQQIVRPGPCDVFVDIDDDAAFCMLMERLHDLKMHDHPLDLTVVSSEPSRSGLPHRHVYLRASRELSPVERIALQACLGSDRVREFLSLMRFWLNGESTTFFEEWGWSDPRKVVADEPSQL